MSKTAYLKVKKNCLVYYSLPDERNYNEKSKDNLVQNKKIICEKSAKELKKIKDENEISCIKTYTDKFLDIYNKVSNQDYKRSFSRTQQKKISESTNTFIDIVKNNYRRSKGLKQRMITFVTLTIPENQKHTDKVMVKTLIDFIDHLKKVKNTLIQNKNDTNFELLKLENYVWRAETTELGNIHFHLLFDTYVNHVTLKRVWNNYLLKLGYENGENSANIHNLQNINDVGGYITKYLTKEPLNNEFNELLKSGQISHGDLDNYAPGIKFRRPILYKSWGSSKRLKNLTSPTFSGNLIYQFNEIKDKCEKVDLSDDLKDLIKIYKGKIYDLLSKSSNALKNVMKEKFNYLYNYLYKKSDNEIKNLSDLIKLHSLKAPIYQEIEQIKTFVKIQKYQILSLF